MSWPLMRIWPLLGSYIRNSRRMRVDLPLPLVPTSAQLLPAGTLRLTPCMTARL